MKKSKIEVMIGFAVFTMLSVGCKNNFDEINISETKNTNSSEISLKINELKKVVF